MKNIKLQLVAIVYEKALEIKRQVREVQISIIIELKGVFLAG